MHNFGFSTILLILLVIVTIPCPGADFGPTNPFYSPSTLPFQAPPFDKITNADYQPAMEAGMAEQLKQIEAIANSSAAPTFENTFVPMEKSGRLLQRVQAAFFAVVSANNNPELLKIRQVMAPKLAAHNDAIYLNAKLFQRVSAIYKDRQKLNLDPESVRLVEDYYKDFVRAGAKSQ